MFGWFKKKQPSEMARALISLLRDDPDGWTFTRYDATHRGAKVGVWIGNKEYGLTVRFNIPGEDSLVFLQGAQVMPSKTDCQALYAAFGQPEVADDRRVIDAIGEWREQQERA